MARILIVDDEPEVRDTMCSLGRRRGFECGQAADLSEARAKLDGGGFDVVLLDLRLPDGNGLDLMSDIKGLDDPPEVIILTGRGDPDGAELAIQGGVWDYLVKPASIKQISLSLDRAARYREEKRRSGGRRALELGRIKGSSPAMRACFDQVATASASDAAVLVTGETGSGKELFARTIHTNSARAAKPFVVVDCASLTDTLVESTLFGHRKGSFTGATEDRKGLVAVAHGGTLFLDEVGELPGGVQKSLLRVLQEKRYRPVGATKEEASDFRLISATNRDLELMVEEGAFRSDLLFRLKTVHLRLPPLRERGEDLKTLAVERVDELCGEHGLPAKGFSADFFEVLTAHDWPGNVRELFNVLERAVVASGRERTLYAMHLPPDLRIKAAKARFDPVDGEDTAEESAGSPGDLPGIPPEDTLKSGLPSLKQHKILAERAYLSRLLEETDGDVARMLELSGLSRSHLYALLKKHDLHSAS
ncbi:sigma-54-dependent transcriptional regulator [Desulfohalovibrio reitneri]|uniref:sigma-54-dependent transcriptional regulator n=1 Tax=Desulfohalovibrio reitneri TaxID=1307759 RepID=UPI0004A7108E|nr:sigma-54 dependent transcriptional regulator [Desulfohalovibrio reitneri]